MNKFEEFHSLRKELATEYEKELQAIHHLLDKGVHVIGGHQDFLSVVDSGAFVSRGRARALFKAAVTKGLESILQQYLLDLTREAVQLGLHASLEGIGETPRISAAGRRDASPRPQQPELDVDPAVDLPTEMEAAGIDPALIRNIVEATRKTAVPDDIDEQAANANTFGQTKMAANEFGWSHGRR